MTPFDEEVDPLEAREQQAEAFLDEDVDSFDVADDDDEDDDDLDDDDDDDADDDDEDESDDDGDDDDDDDYDDLDDASDEDIDFVVALYREDGEPVAVPMAKDLANDLDELITQLARIPGDGGALGLVSIAKEIFVLVRVRGRNVQVLLNDSVAGNDWPIARDVVDYLGLEVPDPDDDSDLVGDLGLLTDLGVSEFELEQAAEDLDEDSDVLVRRLTRHLKFEEQFKRAIAQQSRR